MNENPPNATTGTPKSTSSSTPPIGNTKKSSPREAIIIASTTENHQGTNRIERKNIVMSEARSIILVFNRVNKFNELQFKKRNGGVCKNFF